MNRALLFTALSPTLFLLAGCSSGLAPSVDLTTPVSAAPAALSEVDRAHWAVGHEVGICYDNPKEHNVVFFNTHTRDGLDRFPPGRWNVVDVSRLVPRGTKAVGLTSLLIISHGKKQEIADLTVAVRRHGSSVDNSRNYHTQTIAPFAGGGQRTSDWVWCPLSEDLKFEVFWNRQPESPPWPEGSAYGLNMNLVAWMR